MTVTNFGDDEEMVAQFLEWTETAVVRLSELAAQLVSTEGRDEAAAQEVYDLSHNIKGMGSTFDFHLLTSVATSMCEYLKNRDKALVDTKVVSSHVKAYGVILENKIKGDGGEKGAAVLQRLNNIIGESAL